MDPRSTYIGGSDVARIMGVSDYGGPVALWRQKLGLDKPGDSPMLRAGRHVEAFILQEYEATGARVLTGHTLPDGREVWAQQTARHPSYPFLGGTLDALAVRDGAVFIVDAKMSRRAIDSDDEESVPWDWQLQMHHYGWICGIDRAELAVCRMAADMAVIAVPMSLDLDWYGRTVVPQLVEFWRCVETGVQPEPRPFVERDPPPQLGPEAEGAARRYLLAQERIKAAEQAKEEARDDMRRIIDQAGRPRRALAGDVPVSAWVQDGRVTIDAKALRADLPDVADKYTRSGEPSVQVRVSAPRGKRSDAA